MTLMPRTANAITLRFPNGKERPGIVTGLGSPFPKIYVIIEGAYLCAGEWHRDTIEKALANGTALRV